MSVSAPHSITFLTTGLALAGAEIQLVHLATRLKERGWAVQVVSMLTPQALTDQLDAAGIPVDSLGMQPGRPNPLAILRLARVLKNRPPDVLHAHMVHANLLGRVTRALSRVPVPVLISTAHNTIEGGRWVDYAYRWTDRFADLTTNVSQRAVDRYIAVGAVPADKIRRMHNGIDTSHFKPDAEARAEMRAALGVEAHFVWLAVGRFEAAKDYPNMVAAFARVAAARPDARLLIVGQGTLEADVRQQVEAAGLADAIQFLGRREDIARLMNAADAYLMSSAWEGLPMVLLEAASSGLPAVATNVGGNEEIVLDATTGYLVPPKDAGALAGAMQRLMDLPMDAFRAMQQAARAHVQQQFSLEHTVETWEGIYHALLQKSRERF